MEKIKKLFDMSFVLLGIFVFSTIVLYPSIDRKIVYYALPSFLMLRFFLCKSSYQEIRSLLILGKVKSYPWLLLNISIYCFLPMLMANLYQNTECDVKTYWSTIDTGVYYLAMFLFGVCFLNILNNFSKENFSISFFGKEVLHVSDTTMLAPFAFVTSFAAEFMYYFVKSLADSNLDAFYRWEGGSSNANVWAVQASLALIAIVAFYSVFNKGYIKLFSLKIYLKWIIYAYLVMVIASILLSGSFTNIIGISLASIPIFYGVLGFYTLLIALAAVLISVSLLIILDGHPVTVDDLIFPLNKIAKKFLPRMRLWSQVLNKFNAGDFNLWLGYGFCEYAEWARSLLKRKVDHLHNIYYHSFFLYGLPGLYAGFAYLFNIWKQNKYTCAITIYVLVVSCTDASLINSGPQLEFWLALPLFLQRDQVK